jgi:hypothetical protein
LLEELVDDFYFSIFLTFLVGFAFRVSKSESLRLKAVVNSPPIYFRIFLMSFSCGETPAFIATAALRFAFDFDGAASWPGFRPPFLSDSSSESSASALDLRPFLAFEPLQCSLLELLEEGTKLRLRA